ncbi:hypothetical protein BTA51_29415 [Hahella sp. CCB-MM4]|uniref:hypothetical protein n=1 Tax=Hahella sp. (strain CCB-MM4) TaxID=1926491 RepID=UPI000B9B6191|nr:hypothetical protein [Hahella sp. CCB-MM4]OZG69745.1 hypothetical protein BTA51_29415 [Hahella sp. CCB-MM4]
MPSDLISYDEWMKRTAVTGKPRSRLLKQLDSHIRSYEQSPGGGAARWKLKQKLEEWKKSKGANTEWRSSIRNRHGAVEELSKRLAGQGPELQDLKKQYRQDLDHARLGAVYLWSHTHIHDTVFSAFTSGAINIASAGMRMHSEILTKSGHTAAAQNLTSKRINMGYVMLPGEKVIQAVEGSGYLAESGSSQNVFFKAMHWIGDYISKLIDALKAKFSDKVALSATAIKTAVKAIVWKFAASAGPYLSGSLDVFKGLVNGTDAAVTAVTTWWRGRGVNILEGHPQVICDSLRTQMCKGIGAGLYEVLKGAFSASTFIIGGISGAAMNLVFTLLETVTLFILRLREVAHIRHFCKEARAHWAVYVGSGKTRGVHQNPIRFKDWFESYADKSPLIPALTLNTGICGDKMHFLDMFRSNGYVISQYEFDRGVKYVDTLKTFSAEYIGKQSYLFHSSDKMVNGLLDAAKKFDNGEHGKFREVFLKVTNA